MILLCCFATIAGKYKARLIRAFPNFDKLVCFKLVPDCLFLGVTPACAAMESVFMFLACSPEGQR
jgi:hypothetical protein